MPSVPLADNLDDDEPDRPPAGTPCCVCKYSGHWCQAEQFVAGDSGKGICKACVEGRDCAVRAIRNQKQEIEPPEPLDPKERKRRDKEARLRKVQEEMRERQRQREEKRRQGVREREEEASARAAQLRAGQSPPNGYEIFDHAAHIRESSLSPVDQGKRATYVIPEQVRLQIAAEPPEIDNSVLAGKYACSRATIDNIRKSAGVARVSKETEWGAIIERCLALKEGEQYVQPVLWDLGRARFLNQMRCMLSQHGEGCHIQWSVQTIWEPDEDGVGEAVEDRVQVTRGKDRRALRTETTVRTTAETTSTKIQASVARSIEVTETKRETRAETKQETEPPAALAPPPPAPPPDLTLSRAFELVIAEYNKGIAVMSGDFAGDEDGQKIIQKMKTVVEDLRESHPAVSEASWTGAALSVYDLARKQAEGELAVINAEAGRLARRKKALEEILAVLKKHEDVEAETR